MNDRRPLTDAELDDLVRWCERRPRVLIAAARAELRRPCPHGVPRDRPCAACSEEVPF